MMDLYIERTKGGSFDPSFSCLVRFALYRRRSDFDMMRIDRGEGMFEYGRG